MGILKLDWIGQNEALSMPAEEFYVLVHYVYILNPQITENFLFAGESDYIYLSYNQLPIIGLEYEDDDGTVHWDINALQEVSTFIGEELIPALEGEGNETNMIDILGGWDYLIDNINEGNGVKGIRSFLSEASKKYINKKVIFYISIADILKRLIDEAISINEPYNVVYIN